MIEHEGFDGVEGARVRTLAIAVVAERQEGP